MRKPRGRIERPNKKLPPPVGDLAGATRLLAEIASELRLIAERLANAAQRRLRSAVSKNPNDVSFVVVCKRAVGSSAQTKIPHRVVGDLAGATRFEHATDGFGDRNSTVELRPFIFAQV